MSEVTQVEGIVSSLATPTLGSANVKSIESHVAAFVSLVAGGIAYYVPEHSLTPTQKAFVTGVLVIGAVLIELFHIRLKGIALKAESLVKALEAKLIPASEIPVVDSVAKTAVSEVLDNAKSAQTVTVVASTPPPS